MGVVDDAVEDSVGESGFEDDAVDVAKVGSDDLVISILTVAAGW